MVAFNYYATLAFAGLAAALPAFQGPNKITNKAGLAWYNPNLSQGSTQQESGYQCFYGNPSRYPPMSAWLPFNVLWKINSPLIAHVNGNNWQWTNYIQHAIIQVSTQTNIDARIILAIVMQESTGQASVPCTGTAPNQLNCGLMQGPWGSHGFDSTHPWASILLMIEEGVTGTSSGGANGIGAPGFVQYMGTSLSWLKNPYPFNPYAAARAYNSGRVTNGNLDQAPYGTASYANDIANRLLGWGNTHGDPFSSQCV